MYVNTKQLALDDKKKEFDEDAMREDQLKMYVLLQIAILFFEIIIPIQALVFFAWDELEDKHAIAKGKCVLNTTQEGQLSLFVKDSFVTQSLHCVAFSLPLQQFISCFYTIPIQYDMFKSDSKGSKEMKELEEGQKMVDQDADKDDTNANAI